MCRGVGVVGELQHLAGDEARGVVDDVAVQFQDLTGAAGVVEGVAGDRPQCVVGADLVNRPGGRHTGVDLGLTVLVRTDTLGGRGTAGARPLGRGVGERQVQLHVRPAGAPHRHAVAGASIGAGAGRLVAGQDLAFSLRLRLKLSLRLTLTLRLGPGLNGLSGLAGRVDEGRVQLLGRRNAYHRALVELGDLRHPVLVGLPQGAIVPARVVVHTRDVPEVLAVLHPVEHGFQLARAAGRPLATGAGLRGRCTLAAAWRRFELEALLLVGVGVRVGRSGERSLAFAIVQAWNLALHLVHGRTAAVMDWHPALPHQLLAVHGSGCRRRGVPGGNDAGRGLRGGWLTAPLRP